MSYYCYPDKFFSALISGILSIGFFNHKTTTHHIGEESPTAEAKRKAEAPVCKTKGKWLKITRKGLLVSAIGRVGKQV